MPALLMSTPASARARAALSRYITPQDFADRDHTTGLWMPAASTVTLVDTNKISSLANMVSGGTAFTNATSGRQPVYATDSLIGQPVMEFASAGTSYLNGPTTDYTDALTQFALFRAPTNGAVTRQSIIGSFDSPGVSSNGFFVSLEADGGIILFADTNITPLLEHQSAGDVWQLAISTNDGSDGASFKLGRNAFVQRAMGSSVSKTTFLMGHSVSSASLRGKIAMVGTLDIDLSDGANADELSILLDMVSTYAGNAVAV